MGLLDFGRKKANTMDTDESDSILGRGKDTLKEASIKSAKMAIKGSGLLIRKAYELRINVVNEFSDVKPDWKFVDSDTVKNRIATIEKELESVETTMDKENLANQLLILHAMLPDNLEKCGEIVKYYHLSSPFALHGVLCLQKEKEKDFVGALNEALCYYERNSKHSEHPKVSFYITKALINRGDYKSAAITIKDVLKSYPDNKQVHRIALQIHQYQGNREGIEIEKNILSLL